MSDHDDFAFDHAPGLPEPLPPGETLLWQGSPDWRTLARRPFRVRLVALWFALVVAWLALSGLYRGESLAALAPGLLVTAAGGAAAVGLLAGLAFLTARSTLWSITTRRVLIRFGIALPVDMNLPFARIRSAALALEDDAAIGTIALELVAEERVSYGVMWPHVGPSPRGRTRPALRAVPRAAEVARLLGEAVATAGGHVRSEPTFVAPAEPVGPGGPVDPATAPARPARRPGFIRGKAGTARTGSAAGSVTGAVRGTVAAAAHGATR